MQQIDDPTSYEVTHGLPFETHPYNVSDKPFQNITLTNQQNNQSAVAGSQHCCAFDKKHKIRTVSNKDWMFVLCYKIVLDLTHTRKNIAATAA